MITGWGSGDKEHDLVSIGVSQKLGGKIEKNSEHNLGHVERIESLQLFAEFV